MADDYFSAASRPAGRSRSRGVLLAAVLLLALTVGAAAAVWAGRELGWLDLRLGGQAARPTVAAPAALPTPEASAAGLQSAQTALAVRIAELEQRMARLNVQADAASGNAARAEDLLVASAARRAIERGAPLGYLEDQLKLRFGDSQPNAVNTLIEVSKAPVTLDALTQGFTALGPALVAAPSSVDLVTRVRDELSELFVIRKRSAPSPAPQRRLERAEMFLETARPEAAIAEVEMMPGRDAARDWLTLARRYVRAQRALDLIETAAILEPRTSAAPSPPVPAPAG